jgi:RNA polymerase sigma-70 factor (ECF subfamily)
LRFGRRYTFVNASPVNATPANATQLAQETTEEATATQFDIEALFRLHYVRVVRLIARVVRDRAGAEDLAVELFLKLWRVRPECPEGWLYRAAGRTAIDHLRRQMRRARYERVARFFVENQTPEELHASSEERERVQRVLAAIDRRKAELLLLRSEGLSYEELAEAFDLKALSIGTLLNRAQEIFRKEYVKRYGHK